MVEACYIPKTLAEALKIRAEVGAVPLAGGTDLLVQNRTREGIPCSFDYPVMIIAQLKELKGITQKEDGTVVIKAATTSAEIASDERVPYFVREAAGRMGAISLRNTATIGGNLGNASPKGDLPQPLILLDATVVLKSEKRERRFLVDEFIMGAKKTKLEKDELIYEIEIPKPDYTYAYYRKIGTRKANAISKLSLSCLMKVEDGIITDFRASTGAAGPKIARSRDVESIIIGKKLSEIKPLIPEVLEGWQKVISPRAMAMYRRESTRRMMEYFLTKCSEEVKPGIIE